MLRGRGVGGKNILNTAPAASDEGVLWDTTSLLVPLQLRASLMTDDVHRNGDCTRRSSEQISVRLGFIAATAADAG